MNDLRLGNCFEVLEDVKSVDMILTDPPYSDITHGIKRRSGPMGVKKGMGFDTLGYIEMDNFIDMCAEKCKGWVCIFTDYPLMKVWNEIVQKKELGNHPPTFGLPFRIWKKTNGTPNHHNDKKPPQGGIEFIYTFWNGDVDDMFYNGGYDHIVYEHVTLNGAMERNGHPNEKPEGLIDKIVAGYSREGDTILDPFLGSGTTAISAMKLNRHTIGCEVNADYMAICEKRIDDASRQGSLLSV